jgi:hexosaminidase
MPDLKLKPLLIAALVLAFPSLCVAEDLPLIPIPASVVSGEGVLHIRDGAGVETPAGDMEAAWDARWLQGSLAKAGGVRLSLDADHPLIRFVRLSAAPELGAEGYRLIVSPSGAQVEAAGGAGLFYGAASLLQLLTPQGDWRGPATLQAVRIQDKPRFVWRGLMLDSARHLQAVAFIEALLDQMARYKLNVFHWHLTDDQGWRLQIKAYPRLTQVGAWRVEAGAAHRLDIDPKTGAPRLYGGFYTADQVRAVVAFAAARHITVVPEIEMPGHATAAILAYSDLGVRPADPKTISDWGVFPNLYRPDEKSFGFLERVLTEVMALFPGPYIHVGGDEAIKTYWKASPAVQAQIKALGLKDENALQSWFVQRIQRFLAAHGRRMVGWDEILDGGLPSGAVVMSWRGTAGAVAAAEAGHDAVLTPGLPFYFDNRQSGAADEPPGRGLIITLKNVYGFDPTPKTLAPAAAAHILGLQANVWTEHVRTDARVEHMAFPRALALAEMAWSPPERRDWASFVARVPAAIRRDQALGLEPAESAFEVQAAMTYDAGAQTATVALSDLSGYGAVRYTTDGTAPTTTSPFYAGPLSLPLPTTLRAQAFAAGRALSPAILRRYDATSVLRRDNHDLASCTDRISLNVEDDAPVASDHRAVILTDIVNPCWLWKGADLTGIAALAADVANLPFNYQLGTDPPPVLAPPVTAAGELDVRLDGCGGPLLAVLPLAPAVRATALTTLRATIPPTAGRHDLCFSFARPALDPLWALDAVQLVASAAPAPAPAAQ